MNHASQIYVLNFLLLLIVLDIETSNTPVYNVPEIIE